MRKVLVVLVIVIGFGFVLSANEVDGLVKSFEVLGANQEQVFDGIVREIKTLQEENEQFRNDKNWLVDKCEELIELNNLREKEFQNLLWLFDVDDSTTIQNLESEVLRLETHADKFNRSIAISDINNFNAILGALETDSKAFGK